MGITLQPSLKGLIDTLAALTDAAERQRRLRAALAEVDAVAFLMALRDEAERQRQIDTQASLRLAEAVVDGAVLASLPEHAALGDMARADALWLLGQYDDAARVYEAARERFAALGHAVGWARTHIGWVIVCYYLGRGALALDAIGPARALLVEREEWLRLAALDLNAGYVCWRLGRYVAALERYEQAEATFRRHVPGADLKIAWINGNRALVLVEMGRFDEALALHAQARAVFLTHGDTNSVLRTDAWVADVLTARGDYTRALDLHERTRAALEHAGLGVDAAWTLLGMVTCYLGLNRAAEAAELAQDAVNRFTDYGTPTEVARARYSAALALADLAEYEDAHRHLALAADTFARSGDTHQAAVVALQQAGLALAQAQWSEALAAATAAADSFTAQQQPVPAARAHLARARAYLALSDWTRGADAGHAALAVAVACDVPGLEYQAHHVLARVTEQVDGPSAAHAAYAAALASIDRLQSRLATEWRLTFLDDKLDVYHDAIDCAVRDRQVDLALGHLERAKSRALIDYLTANPEATQHDGDDPESQALATAIARLRAEHAWLASRRYGESLVRRPNPGLPASGVPADQDTLAGAVADRERQIVALAERLALRRAAANGARPDSGHRLWARPDLPADTVVLEYWVRHEAAAVFIVTADAVTYRPLPTSGAAVRRLMQFWQLNLEATAAAVDTGQPTDDLARNARGLLAALHRLLIAPVGDAIAHCRRLVVVPYGPLHGVPFQALFDGTHYLVERTDVSLAPALELVRLSQSRPPRDGVAVVVGHSAGGLLPGAVAEAAVVAELVGGRLLLEEQATTAAVQASAAASRLLHIAAHGEARLDRPAFAHVLLDDGHLTTADVFGLDLRGAVVVLSACETGRGQVVGGDEVVGLSRGFLAAGAAALVQTQWRVEDEATASLIEAFYGHVMGGAATGTALCQAQRRMIAGGGRQAEPYYWAAFQSVGDALLA